MEETWRDGGKNTPQLQHKEKIVDWAHEYGAPRANG